MKLKPLAWIGVFLIAVVVGIAIKSRVDAHQDQAAYREQLRLAWAEGLATTGAQYASAIRPCKAEDNAAPLYRALKAPMHALGVFSHTITAFEHDPNPAHLRSAQALLARAKPALDIVGVAITKPRCWFDRNWSDGAAVLFPELIDMKAATRLLALRGDVAAASGHEAEAVADTEAIQSIAKHADEEGSTIGSFVAESMRFLALHALANWQYRHPASVAYRRAFDRALNQWPQPNLRRELRGELLDALSMIDLCETAAGRRKLGLKEEDLPSPLNPLTVLLSQPKSKIALVKAERDAYAALKLPPKDMARVRSDAEQRIDLALLAFPVAGKMLDMLSSRSSDQDEATERLDEWRAGRLEVVAWQRALASGAVAKTIRTDDLLSPYTGKPVDYKRSATQVVITVETNDAMHPRRFTVPPDAPKS